MQSSAIRGPHMLNPMTLQSSFNPDDDIWLDIEFIYEQLQNQGICITSGQRVKAHAPKSQAEIAHKLILLAAEPMKVKINRWFDAEKYLLARPDVLAAGLNPYIHYFSEGYRENSLNDPKKPGERLLKIRNVQMLSTQPLNPSEIKKAWTSAVDIQHLLTLKVIASMIKNTAGQRGLAISISHDNPYETFGGIQRIIRRETTIFTSNEYTYLHIRPAFALPFIADMLEKPQQDHNIVALSVDGRFAGLCHLRTFSIAMKTFAESKPYLFIHHLIGFPIDAIYHLVLAYARTRRAYFWVHDRISSCISYNLLFNDLFYCGSPKTGSPQCNMCKYGENRTLYLHNIGKIMSINSLQFVFPSIYARDQQSREYGVIPSGSLKIVRPLMQMSNLTIKSRLVNLKERKCRIAFVGAAVTHKGWDEFSILSSDAVLSKNYEWHYIGASSIPQPLKSHFADGSSPDQSIKYALSALEIDMVMIWTLCPETFCFTAHEALEAGCHILTSDCTGNVVHGIPSNLRTVFGSIDNLYSYLITCSSMLEISYHYAQSLECIESDYSYSLVADVSQ